MKIVRRSLFILIGALFLLILFELVLTVAFYIKDDKRNLITVKDYPYLYFLQLGGNNPHGFSTNHTIGKPEGKYRIIMVGGSVARGDNTESTIAVHLEKELKKRVKTNEVEVVNAGVSAFVVQQEFLLIQMILQEYEPDMIIGLDGYNDLYTLYNLWFYDPEFMLPPQNWKDFRVIRDNKKGRFRTLFPSINRLVTTNYLFDLDDIDQKQIEKINETYWDIIQDTRDFCKAKGITYFNFLQPIKWYPLQHNATQHNTTHSSLSKEIL